MIDTGTTSFMNVEWEATFWICWACTPYFEILISSGSVRSVFTSLENSPMCSIAVSDVRFVSNKSGTNGVGITPLPSIEFPVVKSSAED